MSVSHCMQQAQVPHDVGSYWSYFYPLRDVYCDWEFFRGKFGAASFEVAIEKLKLAVLVGRLTHPQGLG